MNCCDSNKDIARWIPPFSGFTEFTTSIPKIYWDTKSQEQRIHGICAMLDKLICYTDNIADKVNINKEDIDELTEMFNQFIESGFDDYYAKQIEACVNKNVGFIFDKYVKQIYFGLTENGYFVAYIPDSWDDIIFDTGLEYGVDTYGRLIMRWDVDNSGNNVNQRPEDWS